MKLSYPRSTRPKHNGAKKLLQSNGPNLTEILNEICDIFKQPVEMVSGPCKKEELVCCKRIFCYVSCILTNATLEDIGIAIGIDHSTVMHHRHKAICWKSTNDSKFINEWIEYTSKSKFWTQYENERP